MPDRREELTFAFLAQDQGASKAISSIDRAWQSLIDTEQAAASQTGRTSRSFASLPKELEQLSSALTDFDRIISRRLGGLPRTITDMQSELRAALSFQNVDTSAFESKWRSFVDEIRSSAPFIDDLGLTVEGLRAATERLSSIGAISTDFASQTAQEIAEIERVSGTASASLEQLAASLENTTRAQLRFDEAAQRYRGEQGRFVAFDDASVLQAGIDRIEQFRNESRLAAEAVTVLNQDIRGLRAAQATLDALAASGGLNREQTAAIAREYQRLEDQIQGAALAAQNLATGVALIRRVGATPLTDLLAQLRQLEQAATVSIRAEDNIAQSGVLRSIQNLRSQIEGIAGLSDEYAASLDPVIGKLKQVESGFDPIVRAEQRLRSEGITTTRALQNQINRFEELSEEAGRLDDKAAFAGIKSGLEQLRRGNEDLIRSNRELAESYEAVHQIAVAGAGVTEEQQVAQKSSIEELNRLRIFTTEQIGKERQRLIELKEEYSDDIRVRNALSDQIEVYDRTLASSNGQLDRHQSAVNSATYATQNLGFAIQDASQFSQGFNAGMRAIANNLDSIIYSISITAQKIEEQGSSFRQLLTDLRASKTFWLLVGIVAVNALTSITAILSKVLGGLAEWEKAVDGVARSFVEVSELSAKFELPSIDNKAYLSGLKEAKQEAESLLKIVQGTGQVSTRFFSVEQITRDVNRASDEFDRFIARQESLGYEYESSAEAQKDFIKELTGIRTAAESITKEVEDQESATRAARLSLRLHIKELGLLGAAARANASELENLDYALQLIEYRAARFDAEGALDVAGATLARDIGDAAYNADELEQRLQASGRAVQGLLEADIATPTLRALGFEKKRGELAQKRIEIEERLGQTQDQLQEAGSIEDQRQALDSIAELEAERGRNAPAIQHGLQAQLDLATLQLDILQTAAGIEETRLETLASIRAERRETAREQVGAEDQSILTENLRLAQDRLDLARLQANETEQEVVRQRIIADAMSELVQESRDLRAVRIVDEDAGIQAQRVENLRLEIDNARAARERYNGATGRSLNTGLELLSSLESLTQAENAYRAAVSVSAAAQEARSNNFQATIIGIEASNAQLRSQGNLLLVSEALWLRYGEALADQEIQSLAENNRRILAINAALREGTLLWQEYIREQATAANLDLDLNLIDAVATLQQRVAEAFGSTDTVLRLDVVSDTEGLRTKLIELAELYGGLESPDLPIDLQRAILATQGLADSLDPAAAAFVRLKNTGIETSAALTTQYAQLKQGLADAVAIDDSAAAQGVANALLQLRQRQEELGLFTEDNRDKFNELYEAALRAANGGELSFSGFVGTIINAKTALTDFVSENLAAVETINSVVSTVTSGFGALFEQLAQDGEKSNRKAFEIMKGFKAAEVIANGIAAVWRAYAELGPIAGTIAAIGIAAKSAADAIRIRNLKPGDTATASVPNVGSAPNRFANPNTAGNRNLIDSNQRQIEGIRTSIEVNPVVDLSRLSFDPVINNVVEAPVVAPVVDLSTLQFDPQIETSVSVAAPQVYPVFNPAVDVSGIAFEPVIQNAVSVTAPIVEPMLDLSRIRLQPDIQNYVTVSAPIVNNTIDTSGIQVSPVFDSTVNVVPVIPTVTNVVNVPEPVVHSQVDVAALRPPVINNEFTLPDFDPVIDNVVRVELPHFADDDILGTRSPVSDRPEALRVELMPISVVVENRHTFEPIEIEGSKMIAVIRPASQELKDIGVENPLNA